MFISSYIYGCWHYPYQQFCKAIIAKKQRNEQKNARLCSKMTSYDEDVTVVKWLDNKITHLASNFVAIGKKI